MLVIRRYHLFQTTCTINRRINNQDIRISERHEVGNDDDIIIALDRTGIKVANRGEWIRHKWHVRRGYLKIHVAVNDKMLKKIVLIMLLRLGLTYR